MLRALRGWWKGEKGGGGRRGGERGEEEGLICRWYGLTELLGDSILLDEPEAQSTKGVAL